MSKITEAAIVGAGPFGLSIAAQLQERGVPFRIFGPPMETWRKHMPAGMRLKSDGFASDLYDNDTGYTLKRYCAEHNIAYDDLKIPVQLETFIAYGLAFQARLVPSLENKVVVGLKRNQDIFELTLDNVEQVQARKVVLAIGITHFAHTPSLISRHPVKFHQPPGDKPRSLWQRLRKPHLGLGASLRSAIYTLFPNLFHYVPQKLRLRIVRRHLGPSGGWYIRDHVVGKVALHSGFAVQSATTNGADVELNFSSTTGGAPLQLRVDHVIAATGYKPAVERLGFLDANLASQLRTEDQSPVLSRNFESTVPGLYFVGVAAANSFGPLLRFALGADFSARRICAHLDRVTRRIRADNLVAAIAQ